MKKLRIARAYRLVKVRFTGKAPEALVTGSDYHGKQVASVQVPHQEDKHLVPSTYDFPVTFHDGMTEIFTHTPNGILGPDGLPAQMVTTGGFLTATRLEIAD